METKASYIVTGAFTLAVIAGVFGFIYWVQGGGRSADRPSIAWFSSDRWRGCIPAPRCSLTVSASER